MRANESRAAAKAKEPLRIYAGIWARADPEVPHGIDGSDSGKHPGRSEVTFPTMTTKTLFLIVLAALGGAAASAATPADQSRAQVEVIFFEPEKFSDVRADLMGSEKDRDYYLQMLREHLVERVAAWLPAGSKLSVTVFDVDMAGEFEPWRGPRFQDIRIVKDIYPPRVTLEFKLVNARGEIVAQGRRELRDLTFMMNLSINRNDSLRHEKQLLDEWLRDEFRRDASS